MTVIERVAVEAMGLIERALVEGRTPTPTDAAAATTTSNSAAATTSAKDSDGNGSAANSPLLFFVALGFGVVFTNLWIIVGVKYCFRYNARNRQARAAEMGDPIVMDNMPRRRRKRDKKLMTMEEVNERFPMTKYKTWISSRASEGLPTSGGISVPPSRAGSLINAEGIVPSSPLESKHSDDERPVTAASANRVSPGATTSTEQNSDDPASNEKQATDPDTSRMSILEETRTVDTTPDPKQSHEADDDDDDDEHIHTAVPPELLNSQGDTCAICLDVIEQDDDIRALTCGHAFHAVCLDPWLTSRRACCPLCKADYYIPKPRAEDEHQTPDRPSRRPTMGRPNMPSSPPSAWTGIRGNPRLVLPGRFIAHHPSPADSRSRSRTTRPTPSRSHSSRTTAATAGSEPSPSSRSWLPSNPFNRSWVPHIRLHSRTPSDATGQPSPGQLEAGTR